MTLENREAQVTEAPAAEDTEFLLQYLRTHDALCPLCRYNLRNLTVPRCPECGRVIRLTVGLVEQRLASFIVMLSAFFPPAGLGFLLLLVKLTPGYGGPSLFRFHSFAAAMESLILQGFIATIPAGILAVLLRRRFLRLSARWQWTLALVSLLVPVVLFGGWTAMRMH